jgi:hypothetical protein
MRKLKKKKMNTWLIVAAAFTGVGVILGIIGGIIQQRSNSSFEQKVLQSVELTQDVNRPEINVLDVHPVKSNNNMFYRVIFKNTGNMTAQNLKMYLDEHISPMGAGDIQGIKILPSNVQSDFNIEAFPHANMILNFKDEGEDGIMKRELSNLLKDFYNKDRVMVIKFHFEYMNGENTYQSPNYSLTHDFGQPVEVNSY